MRFLPLLSPLADYEAQAEKLLALHAAGDPGALRIIHERHPRFLDDEVKWLPKRILREEILAAPFDLDDARLTVARGYCFLDWESLAAHVAEVLREGSPVREFERAAEAVIDGDADSLRAALACDPDLVRARSTRVTRFDPPVHRATLLHYLAANGVENYRQRSPRNAPEIARLLLERGAEPDALASMYGGECTTLSMLASSTPAAEAGVQIALIDTLVDFGAAVESCGSGNWHSPLLTALVFGFRDAADALVRRGARVATLDAAAGLGRAAEVERMLASASPEERHRALALAAQLGHVEIVRLLLAAGETPDRFNPEGRHAHATPLHHAAGGGHLDVVRLLVERGARLDIEDRLWRATPLGWAEHSGHGDVARFLAGQTR
jgi:ankyrin repeat protein